VTPNVAWISIAPVKGLALVHPGEVVLERVGVPENRRLYLIDDAGRLANGKRFGPLMGVRPELDGEHLTLHLPDGTTVASELTPGDPVETSFYGRPVAGRVVGGPFAEALSQLVGRRLRVVRSDEPGAANDRGLDGAVSLLSTAALGTLGPEALDGRRFRMLFGIGGVAAHEEDSWIGREVRIGDAVVMPRGNVGRCLVTGLDPDTGRRTFDTLGALRERRGDMETTEPLPFGVWGAVIEPGRVRLGDPVST
jgi:uncharacterized protein YcbX